MIVPAAVRARLERRPRIHRAYVLGLSVALAAATTGCSSSPSASVASRGVAPASSESTPDEPAIDDLSWLYARSIEENDVTIAVELALVRSDGMIAWTSTVEIAPSVAGGPFVIGPRNGVLVYGVPAEGDVVGISAVRASDGGVLALGEVEGTVVGSALGPDGMSTYLAVSGPTLKVWRFPVTGEEPVELAELSNAAQFTANRLHVTPDGTQLVLDDCVADACAWTIIDLVDGAVRAIEPAGAGRFVDLSNDMLLAGASGCEVGPCPFVLVDLDAGETTEWDPGVHVARLAVAADGRTLLLHDEQGMGAVDAITITDPLTGEHRVVDTVDRNGIALGLARAGQDSWVPVGWELLTPPGTNVGEMGGPTLMRLEDGTLLQLPAASAP